MCITHYYTFPDLGTETARQKILLPLSLSELGPSSETEGQIVGARESKKLA